MNHNSPLVGPFLFQSLIKGPGAWVWMLWADLDQEPLAVEAVADLIRPLGCDYEILIQHSHFCFLNLPTSLSKRWELDEFILSTKLYLFT